MNSRELKENILYCCLMGQLFPNWERPFNTSIQFPSSQMESTPGIKTSRRHGIKGFIIWPDGSMDLTIMILLKSLSFESYLEQMCMWRRFFDFGSSNVESIRQASNSTIQSHFLVSNFVNPLILYKFKFRFCWNKLRFTIAFLLDLITVQNQRFDDLEPSIRRFLECWSLILTFQDDYDSHSSELSITVRSTICHGSRLLLLF